nr:hypothetical transcript [Hymenolepis microstoma]
MVLSVVDIITGFLLAFLSLDHFILRFIPGEEAHYVYCLIEDIFGEIIDILLLISNWLTVAVAVERYLAICFPLSVRFVTHRFRKRIVHSIILLSIFLQFPSLAKYCTLFHSLYKFLAFFNLWFTRVFVLLVIPCSILIFVTIRLIQAIRSSFILKHGGVPSDCSSSDDCTSACKWNISNSTRLTVAFTLNGPLARERSRHATKEERAITINLVSLIIVFFICQVPFILLSVAFRLFDPETASFRGFDLALYYEPNQWNEEVVNQTVILSPVFTVNTSANAVTPVFDKILTYIRAFSVLFLMLKGDLYFLFYCWLCNNFLRAVKTFLHI